MSSSWRSCTSRSACVCAQVLLFLNNAIGKKGPMERMTDYWDVATFFEIKLLMEDYGHCVRAAECMYRLNPPAWYLHSTLTNISIIEIARQKRAAEAAAAQAHALQQQASTYGSSAAASASPANSLASADRPLNERAKQVRCGYCISSIHNAFYIVSSHAPNVCILILSRTVFH